MSAKILDLFRKHFLIGGLAGLAAVLISQLGRATDVVRVDLPKVAQGALGLRVLGTAGTRYDLELSTNLTTWTLLSSGVAQTNGWSFSRNTSAFPNPAFFRAVTSRTNPPSSAIHLRYGEDTNQVVQLLITTNGGSFDTYTAEALRLTLTVPPYSLPEDTFISMSVVTNVTGLPFAKGSIATVKLEPSGLGFWGAAQLDIECPSDTPYREIITFTAGTDGTGFGLIPGLVYTNHISIPLTELGLVGVALATDTEWNAFIGSRALTRVAAQSRSRSTGRAVQSTSEDCHAALKQTAIAIAEGLRDAVDVFADSIAIDLTEARRRDPEGVNQDSNRSHIAERADTYACLFHHNWIEPRYAEAAGNCALAGVLTQFMLSMEKMRQLLGSTRTDCGGSLISMPFCQFGNRCLQEIRECCAIGHRGTHLVASALALEQQSQMVGMDCGLTDAVRTAMEECFSNAWTGTFSVKMHGQERFSPRPGVTRDKQLALCFQGEVIESIQRDGGDGGFDLSLRVSGQFLYRKYSQQVESISFSCPGSTNTESHFSLSEQETTVAAPSEYLISISAHNGRYVLNALHFYSQPGFEWPGKERRLTFTRFIPCGSPAQVYHFASNEPADVLGPPLTFQGTLSDTNSISDGQSFPFSDSPPAQMHFHWKFQRHRPGS